MKTPVATYRLQFHAGWTLRQATELLPYLHDLGVSHVYASPLLKARAQSTHGYDVCAPESISPEIGSEQDLHIFVEALRKRGMGLVLDIVPNHLAAVPENPHWRDVLKFGQRSRFADWFDIDWESPDPDLRGKVLLPVLAKDLVSAVKEGDVVATQGDGELAIRYGETVYPACPESYPADASHEKLVSALNASGERLVHLLKQQHYLLAPWREADVRINYRRFFTLNELAGVRVELPHVFNGTHDHILDWYKRGFIDGFRIDHPDGLADPLGYLRRLKEEAPEAWVVVEKILEAGEALPSDWPVAGTTGYDFLARVLGLFVDPAGEKALTEFYAKFTGEPNDYATMVRGKKRWILEHSLAPEVDRLTRLLQSIESALSPGPGTDARILREALIELIACFPVYRTYFRESGERDDSADRVWFARALADARKYGTNPSSDPLAWIADIFLRHQAGKQAPELVNEFKRRFQQLTGPAMAKGVEDTALYCFNRFVALNEVGASPGRFGTTLEKFHQSCRESLARWPDAMLATSTHDTKRSEDVRVRLAVLSEIPDAWADTVRRWSRLAERHRQEDRLDRNAEYLYYQTLVGAWPLDAERAIAFMVKAAREAKVHTTWTEPSESYESALVRFVRGTLADREFSDEVSRFVESIQMAGCLNSLTQTVLKLTAPGVPDIYQGTELWDHSLVDPDNRRPVDFARRRSALDGIKKRIASGALSSVAQELLSHSNEGKIKQYLIYQTLALRQRHQSLFSRGGYEQLTVEGELAKHVCAFARTLGDKAVAVIVPRLSHSLVTAAGGCQPLGMKLWGNTRILLPGELRGRTFRNVFTGEVHLMAQEDLLVGDVFKTFPLAVLE